MTHPTRVTHTSRLLLLVLLGLVSWLALSPAPPPALDSGWDKLNHFGAFAVLTVTACVAYVSRWKVAAALLGYGVFIECVQSLIPSRTAEAADVLADAVGIGIGLAVAAVSLRRRHF